MPKQPKQQTPPVGPPPPEPVATPVEPPAEDDPQVVASGARIYAIAANMLQDVDGEEWTARGLSKGDVMLARAKGSIHLRINSIELGLKHILDREMGRPVPKKHDLVILWNHLTDEWKEKVAEASCVPMEDIREALGQYKDAAVALRYGGSLGRADRAVSCGRYDEEACGGPPETGQHARSLGTPGK